MTKIETRLDHFILGIPDLDRGIKWVQEKTGVTPVKGGSHPGAGTHNALLSLGNRQYMEIMSLDPEQKEAGWTAALIRNLKSPEVITWAAAVDDIRSIANLAKAAGYKLEGPNPGSRMKPDGGILQWRTLTILSGYGAVVPFFIEWDAGIVHPSVDAPSGCGLEAFEILHPEADQVRDILEELGVAVHIQKGGRPQLRAILETPNGRVALP